MTIQHHYVDANGNHFVAEFLTEHAAAQYVPPKGAMQIAQPPSDDYRWVDGKWVLPQTEAE